MNLKVRFMCTLLLYFLSRYISISQLNVIPIVPKTYSRVIPNNVENKNVTKMLILNFPLQLWSAHYICSYDPVGTRMTIKSRCGNSEVAESDT